MTPNTLRRMGHSSPLVLPPDERGEDRPAVHPEPLPLSHGSG